MKWIVSGREYENVSAFFPQADRNLLHELDRRLRSSAVSTVQEMGPASLPSVCNEERPGINRLVEAVEQAGRTMSVMTTRIEDLEHHITTITTQFQTQLADAEQAFRVTEAKLRTETDRSARYEGVAAHQTARAIELERELSAVRTDLARLANAITDTLGIAENAVG